MAEKQTLSITIPVDVHECLRRSCPNCGLDFKMNVSEELLHDLLSYTVGRVCKESGLQDEAEDVYDEPTRSEEKTVCPYCSHSGPSHAFLHPEHESYIRRISVREIVEPMFFGIFDDAFSGLRQSEFIKVTHTRSARSPRPLVGPESGDMVRIRCLACGNLCKVAAPWRGKVSCPFCETDIVGM